MIDVYILGICLRPLCLVFLEILPIFAVRIGYAMIEQTENRLSVAEAQNICLRNNIPFYTYRLPGSREVIFGAQLSNDTRIFKGFEKHRGEKGFVITPFNHSSWSFPFFIKADLSFTDYLTDGEAIRNLQNTVFNTPVAASYRSAGTPFRAARNSTMAEPNCQIRRKQMIHSA